ncbi:MAG: peroxide stress protein YaaA [Candidatus Nanopelagicales bacterium]
MLILLPPSEGKRAPGRGRPVDLATLSFPGLTDARRTVLDALVSLCVREPEAARAALGLSAGQADEVARDADLMTAPAAPALRVYTGVLYEALDAATLDAAAKRRAGRRLAVASALWGLLRPNDRIPAYRLSGGTRLPPLGTLTGLWREPLTAAISEAAGRGVVLDLRSSAYVALAPPAAPWAARTVVARVLQERDGTRTVVSHHNKHTKGLLARALVTTGDDPRTPDDLAGLCGALGFHAELTAPARADRPWTLDLVT